MKFFLFVMLPGILLLAGCGEGKNNDSADNNNAINDAIEQAGPVLPGATSPGGNPCLLGYQDKYDELLTKELVIRETGFDGQNMTTKYTKVMKPEHHSFAYKFNNKRVGKIRGFDRDMEVTDVISVHSIKAMSPEQFARSYRSVSPEEMQAAKEAAKKLTDGRTDEQKDASHKATNSMLDTFKEVSQGYETMDGLGDKAAWNKITCDLAVLQNGVKFEIKADISNDVEKNKSVATKLAKFILTKCR